MVKIIYLISPKKIYKNFFSDLSKVLKTRKVKYFQLRLKNVRNHIILSHLRKIKKITKKNKVKLIINDNPKIAKIMNLDGCHLGQSDMKLKKARELLKLKIIGKTCHNSLNLVKKAVNEKADYIALGSFFNSKLKPKAKKININNLKIIRKRTSIPIVAIGGIDNTNYKMLLRLGVNYIAISSFIWNNPDLKPEIAIKKFK